MELYCFPTIFLSSIPEFKAKVNAQTNLHFRDWHTRALLHRLVFPSLRFSAIPNKDQFLQCYLIDNTRKMDSLSFPTASVNVTESELELGMPILRYPSRKNYTKHTFTMINVQCIRRYIFNGFTPSKKISKTQLVTAREWIWEKNHY